MKDATVVEGAAVVGLRAELIASLIASTACSKPPRITPSTTNKITSLSKPVTTSVSKSSNQSTTAFPSKLILMSLKKKNKQISTKYKIFALIKQLRLWHCIFYIREKKQDFCLSALVISKTSFRYRPHNLFYSIFFLCESSFFSYIQILEALEIVKHFCRCSVFKSKLF